MCLGVPGKIIKTWADEASQLPMGQIDFGGIRRHVCLAFTPDTAVGDYVIVHVGFAISHINEEEAQRTLALLQEMGELEAELGEERGAQP